jgi:hypothetical protein
MDVHPDGWATGGPCEFKTRSMSSIKRDVKKKVLPRPEGEICLEIQPTSL